MGCDIHVFTEEKLNYGNKKGEWFNCDHYKKNIYFGTDEYEQEYQVIPIYDNRNYTLFSILANIRNYGNNEPISEPKGLPQDCCKEIREENERWGCDGHSHSYFTLKELIDWKNTHPYETHQGFVSGKEAALLDKEGKFPECYWQGGNIEGQVWKKWTEPNTSLDILIDALKQRTKEVFHIYSDDDSQIYEKADDIRIVFWFDN